MAELQTCTQCGKSKCGYHFYLNKTKCKACRNIESRSRPDAPKPRRSADRPGPFECTACKQVLPRDQFPLVRPGVLDSRCRGCKNARGREYRRRQKEGLPSLKRVGTPKSQKEYERRKFRAAQKRDCQYDYALARAAFGMTHKQARDWVVRGYKLEDNRDIFGYMPDEFEFSPPAWQPDKIREEVAA